VGCGSTLSGGKLDIDDVGLLLDIERPPGVLAQKDAWSAVRRTIGVALGEHARGAQVFDISQTSR
jgi:hypothetical protein